MMRVFSVPLRYRRFLADVVTTACAHIALDMEFQADEEQRIRDLSPVPKTLVDEEIAAGGTLLVMFVEQDGREILEVCAKCGLDRRRAEFYQLADLCYPLEGYSTDGLHYPPPAEAHEWVPTHVVTV